ncbi:N-acetyl-gamma-glutamyl-phosphate reductase [Clostridium saccharoperbutylacetonicum]|uniref:N-acetyl-gamma-glutamyl-phosphate reductase n=1 Tax=Clostridium saccharoperbutylacetonicum N1-4(HMT) TaxID=931276 RepID=M1MI56_9CLOT|nr:N-acetyl-gamma-glutamyl-phosphate reductase [Clostridium saccharoperbutylacetonicum]AGF54576.1 N-acetyl-gamma-glutamyl-phosphate reductase ArgC [Clostridium saccharoperbutylacetonicum N1-4(HMT)]NRT58903.1 N-acetyl-gamma-glutamyl-phosphate reductase [Clostridium saccharoperbutylacetonicum]NSB28092.1 N-acetyl-gamma-glutamyl-phosphate reductase [Clostridium saccharoperbutylacetonicum]NSB41579.1 N-acetyl-gamma-glutamyl-phosphate reductase [Clostridium saccharoperbutylacetonicum]
MTKIGIIGATGYVGAELLRLLLSHPKVEIAALSSVSFEGQEISNVYKNFLNKTNLVCETAEDVIEKSDVIFTALPHGLSEDIAKKAIDSNKICIDMGADFRLSNEEEYELWYGKKFTQPEIHASSIYGLPELNRAKIKECSLIANPGCYPTTIELGLMPLLKNSLIKLDNIICDSKSGTTGAGRGLTLNTHFPEENETFAPYKVGAHRHTPEIEETLSVMAKEKVNVTFTPHLLPINRGILSTIYCSTKDTVNLEEIHKLYVAAYKDEPFVNVLPLGEIASIKNVRLTNDCHISLHLNHRKDQIIVVSTIDNMVKGAAGQAIQNMNIILGFEETDGLNLIAPAF